MAKLKGLPASRLPILAPNLAPISYEIKRQQLHWRAWYSTAEWKTLRWKILVAAHFICKRCERMETNPSLLVAHHIVAHKGDWALFWDERNLECICKGCHDTILQKEEANARQF